MRDSAFRNCNMNPVVHSGRWRVRLAWLWVILLVPTAIVFPNPQPLSAQPPTAQPPSTQPLTTEKQATEEQTRETHAVGPEPPEVQVQVVGKSPLRVELRETATNAVFALVGLSELGPFRQYTSTELQSLFSVCVDQDVSATAQTSLPPLLGEYSIDNAELRFESRFPLNSRVKYRVEISPRLLPSSDTASQQQLIVFSSQRKPQSVPAKVVEIYPTANELPENLLKFYIHFSAPMSRGEAYRRIRLMHGNKQVEAPFLELGEELWNTDQTRFTLLIHPGRIKRGLKPREDSGLPMSDGNTYTLSIDAGWLSADRQPMQAPFEKRFQTVAADDQQPHPELWKIGTPKVNTTEPVTLTFSEPLDHAMLNRVLTVRDLLQLDVEGTVSVRKGETQWAFQPREPWKSGVYTIAVATNLEDLCGNSIARPFETAPESASGDSPTVPPMIGIEFNIE